MANRLLNKVAIVTGAGQGIGQAIAQCFAQEGARVVIAELNSQTGQSVVDQLRDEGGHALFIQTDITNPDSVEAMVGQTISNFGSPHVLVNNAGTNVFHEPLEMPHEQWRRCFAVDLDGAWYCSRTVLPHMLKQSSGSIINIASIHAFTTARGSFPYPVAKHGLLGLTRSLGLEYASRNIRVNAILPGYIETQLVTEYCDRFDDPVAAKKKIVDLQPCRRLGQPQEIGMTAVFLASDEAPFLNASCITIDGGLTVAFQPDF